jgi:hypothetical protein
MNWKHILAGFCGFAFGFWLCMPRDAVLQPRWEVLVLDESGHGIAHAAVQEFRQDNVTHLGATSTIQTADSYGRAAFPAVHGRTSPLLRGIACGRQIASQGAHAGCGYFHDITAALDGYVEVARKESDLPLKGRGRLLQLTMRPPGNP